MSRHEALLHPDIPDHDGLDDYLHNLADQVPVVERGIARLRRSPQDKEAIADIFRALHNLKGDASICQVELAGLLVHPLETVFSRLRSGEIVFSEVLAEIALLTLDRIELAVDALAGGRPISHLKLDALLEGLEMLADAQGLMLETSALQLIEDVTGFRPAALGRTFKAGTSGAHRAADQMSEDLRFFQSLAARLDARSPLFKGRNGRLLRLAQETNLAAGKPIDPLQLEAAIHMHDIGMMFLPESAWLKAAQLDADDLALLHQHPLHAAGLMQRMDGWQDAALIVEQHHEMPDGKGYPAGIKGDALCAGARIIAIVDAFESITTKHAERGQSRSVLRAIAEINACDKQFDPVWIGHFNTVVRKRIE